MNTKIIGLDIGTNSIGWAVIEEGKKILGTGVYIFPVGVQSDKYEKNAVEEPKNKTRQTARTTRRTMHRYKLRRKQLTQILQKNGLNPGHKELDLPASELFQLRKKALDERIRPGELGRILMHLNQRRGFFAFRNNSGKEDDSEKGKVKSAISNLNNTLIEGNFRSVGEYFASLFDNAPAHNPDEPSERIRNRFVSREMYRNEFDLIWKKQQEYYPTILTGQKGCNKKDKNLYNEIANRTIFYQRKLRSKKFSRSKCTLMPKEYAIAKSAYLFQEFRYWQKLADMRILNEYGEYISLSIEEKQKIAQLLENQDSITSSKFATSLGIPKAQFNLIEKIEGNKSRFRISTAIGNLITNEWATDTWERVWNLLTFADDEEWLIEKFKAELGLNHELAEKLANVNLEEDYGRISRRALTKIIPYMKYEGMDYTQACIAAGFNHSRYEAKDPIQKIEELYLKNPLEITSPIVRQAVSEALKIIRELDHKFGKAKEVRIEMARTFKLPKADRENLKSKNDAIERNRKEYAAYLNGQNLFRKPLTEKSPEIAKYELWLELGWEIEDKKEFEAFMKANDKSIRAGKVDLIKHRLWLECNRRSPYTGKVITLTQLFSPEIQIEHIAPYSLTNDDSKANKTLCEAKVNQTKGNKMLPLEYLKKYGNPSWNEQMFRKYVTETFHGGKQERLLWEEIPSGFQNAQIVNTGWATKIIGRELRRYYQETGVLFSNGKATSTLRRTWGLNTILHDTDEMDPNLKNRKDHRHHALDAIVVACTDKNTYDRMAKEAEFTSEGRIRLSLSPPWNRFREDAEEKISEILVVHKDSLKVTQLRKNKYQYAKGTRKGNKANPKYELGIRGSLHDETNYGKIQHPKAKEEVAVVRKFVKDLDEKDLPKIIDPVVRECVSHWMKQAADKRNTHPTMASKEGLNIPIIKVRIEARIKPDTLENAGGRWVNPGNNLYFVVYEGQIPKIKKGVEILERKRSLKIISLMEAASRKQKGELLFPPMDEDGLVVKFILKKNNLVILLNEGETADSIDWNNRAGLFSRLYKVIKFTASSIYFGLHNYSKINADKDKFPIKLQVSYNLLNIIPVRLDKIGNLQKVD